MAIEFALRAPAPEVELSDRLLVTPARLLGILVHRYL